MRARGHKHIKTLALKYPYIGIGNLKAAKLTIRYLEGSLS
jgi:hypothetical protein